MGDRPRRQSEGDWAEVEDFIPYHDGLRLIMKQLTKGPFAKVSAGLRESRELLLRNPEHRAALDQFREVETPLIGVACRGAARGHSGGQDIWPPWRVGWSCNRVDSAGSRITTRPSSPP
jgi:hypothetical protein